MERKSFPLELGDGKTYLFTERNVEDVSLGKYQDILRAHKINWINNNIESEDVKFALTMHQINHIYSIDEINLYINSSNDEKLKIIYDSFKIKNSSISFEKFIELFGDNKVDNVLEMIYELESDEVATDAEIAKAIGVPAETYKRWKDNISHLYYYCKKNIKKKVVNQLAKKSQPH